MSSKATSGNNEDNRRRNPSRGIQKGTVGDIADAFKRQMAASSPNSTPVKTGKKSTNSSNRKEEQDLKSKGKGNKKTKPVILEKEEEAQEETAQGQQGQQGQQINTIAQDTVHSSQEFLSANSDSEVDNIVVESTETIESSNTCVKEPWSEDAQPSIDQSQGDNEVPCNHDDSTISSQASAAPNKEVKDSCDNCNNLQIQEMLQEINHKLDKLDSTVYDPKNRLEVQLGKLLLKVEDMHSEIHGAASSLKVRTDQSESKVARQTTRLDAIDQNITRMSSLLGEYKRLSKELTLMQGLIQKNSQQSKHTANKVLDLTKWGMEQNLIIHGIEEAVGEAEDPKEIVINFLKTNLEVDIKRFQIWKAHRMGYRAEGKVRPVIIKVSYTAKEIIMDSVGKLKGLTNSTTGNPLFIGEQIPEGVAENRKHVSTRLKTLRDENDSKPKEEKQTIRAVGDKILINGKLYKEEVVPPEPADLFVSGEKQLEINQVNAELVETESVEINNSVFIGLALHTDSIQKVNTAYKAVAQCFPAADHIMIAYGLRENDSFKHGNCDDGEYGGSVRIKRVLTENKANNTSIFVVRRFGGLHIGANRFRTIEQVALEAYKKLQDQL